MDHPESHCKGSRQWINPELQKQLVVGEGTSSLGKEGTGDGVSVEKEKHNSSLQEEGEAMIVEKENNKEKSSQHKDAKISDGWVKQKENAVKNLAIVKQGTTILGANIKGKETYVESSKEDMKMEANWSMQKSITGLVINEIKQPVHNTDCTTKIQKSLNPKPADPISNEPLIMKNATPICNESMNDTNKNPYKTVRSNQKKAIPMKQRARAVNDNNPIPPLAKRKHNVDDTEDMNEGHKRMMNIKSVGMPQLLHDGSEFQMGKGETGKHNSKSKITDTNPKAIRDSTENRSKVTGQHSDQYNELAPEEASRDIHGIMQTNSDTLSSLGHQVHTHFNNFNKFSHDNRLHYRCYTSRNQNAHLKNSMKHVLIEAFKFHIFNNHYMHYAGNVRMISWNRQGIGNPLTQQYLNDMIKETNPDILFLCETKNIRSVVNPIITRLGYKNCFMVEPIGASGGLMVAWKIGTNLRVGVYNKKLINCHIRNMVTGEESMLYCVYGPSDWNEKYKFWSDMAIMARTRSQQWILIGDLNLTLIEQDKKGIGSFNKSEADKIKYCLEMADLNDLGFVRYPFTWSNKRKDVALTKARLDRAMANGSWSGKNNIANTHAGDGV